MPSAVTVTINDRAVKRVLARGKKLPAHAFERIRDTVHLAAEHVGGVAVDKAPKAVIEGGTLRGSMFVETHAETGLGMKSLVVFGGMATAYAQVQHEREDYHHDKGQAHFLHGSADSAWGEEQEKVEAWIDAELERVAEEFLS